MNFDFRAFKVSGVLLLLIISLLSCVKTSPAPSASPILAPTPESTPPIARTSLASTPQLPATTAPRAPAAPTIPPPTPQPQPSPSPIPVTPSPLPASSTPVPSLQVVASGLEIPWALAFAPDGRLFFTERTGRIRVLQEGKLLEEPVAWPDVAAAGEGGLLGLALDPGFQQNSFLYVYYTYRTAGGELRNKVERVTIKENRASDPKVILDGIPGNAIHDGGRLKFGPDGKLYITTGDAAVSQFSQDQSSLAGKILRLNPDGTVPQDNPFSGSPVYSWGNRNPEGLAWQPGTGLLFATEHSSSAHDELNIIKPGGNYGWPVIRGKESAPQLISPLLESGEETWAPAGMTFYQGAVFTQWKGNIFFGTLRGEHLHRVVLAGQEVVTEEKLFRGELGRIRDVIEGPDGFLYFSTSNRDGRGLIRPGNDHIYRIAPE